jgi:hypothetical protein
MSIINFKKLIAKKSKISQEDNYTKLSSGNSEVLIPVSKSSQEIEKPSLTTLPPKINFHY